MNIREAKRQIKNTMQAYFSKDEFGEYRLRAEKQRPVFLIGAPGIGKTAIMEQIAQELDVGLVSYSMTHHTRQSALGLPFIEHKEYGGKEFSISEYTMSEIIAAIYECIETTGHKEGILFLDEINCVSETLMPAMLQFLQFKIFGRHRVPSGWIVVTAGNPKEYNRTARDFDIATWDRLKRIDVEPDYDSWRDYAIETGVHPAVITYLDIERDNFYKITTNVDRKSFVTARGWDDLSSIIKLYESLNIDVDEDLIGQYIQDSEISSHFAVYYDLFTKYKEDYQIYKVLDGTADEHVYEAARAAQLDERLSLIGLLVDALGNELRQVNYEEDAISYIHKTLKNLQAELKDAGLTATNNVYDQISKNIKEISKMQEIDREAGLLSESKQISYGLALKLFRTSLDKSDNGKLTFNQVKDNFNNFVDNLETHINNVREYLNNVITFVEDVFGKNREMLVLISDLAKNYYGMQFINKYGCDKYFENSDELMFSERGEDLATRIERLDLSDLQENN